MCDQSDLSYSDGDVVWVKLSSCWWPGQVVASDKLPPSVMPSFRKAPIAIVKFFQEDAYEYVKNSNCIYMYNCDKKNEFINKGLHMYRAKHGLMDKFPEDVIRAETAVGGDIEILTRDEFQEVKKQSYAGIFGGNKKKTPKSAKKGVFKSKTPESSKSASKIKKMLEEKSDYQAHILVQSPKTSNQSQFILSPKYTELVFHADKQSLPEEIPGLLDRKSTVTSTPSATSSGIYSCYACPFSTSRLNVLIIHSKTHSATVGATPAPEQKKPTLKQPKSLPPTSKTSEEKSQPKKIKITKQVKKVVKPQKRAAQESSINSGNKKVKTDNEIKISLLADWDDGEGSEDGEESKYSEDSKDGVESKDESSMTFPLESPKVPVESESPAEPVSAELTGSEVLMEKKEDSTSEKAEPSSDSKYDFCEDEDWPVEADAGRKIPRVKNPRRNDTKSLSLDEDEMAKEVAELLSKTAVPELPVAPEPLKVEENFPQPSIIKSPDKRKDSIDEDNSEKPFADATATKAIFKTKTFFRSRHSRSQDIIGKYVAEQLAADRMDIAESDLNGSESVSSPERRDSPPVEHVKVVRLAPKIQLKKMKAEAAQLKIIDQVSTGLDLTDSKKSNDIVPADNSIQIAKVDEINNSKVDIKSEKSVITSRLMDVLYPTQEIKPINCEHTEKYTHTESFDHSVKERNPNIENNSELLEKSESLSPSNQYENLTLLYNKSTASAVDALLSVSRDPDRVTNVVSDDPPEDLFEEDKELTSNSNINGFRQNGVEEEIIVSSDSVESLEIKQSNINGISENETLVCNVAEPENQEIYSSPKSDETLLDNRDIESERAEFITTEPTKLSENVPSESDLQIAEALLNMPGRPILTTFVDNETKFIDLGEATISEDSQFIESEICLENTESDNAEQSESYDKTDIRMGIMEENIVDTTSTMPVRFETEQEKRDNLKAAQSLVQMSESLELSAQNTDDILLKDEGTAMDSNVASECIIECYKDTSSNYVDEQMEPLTKDDNCEITSTSTTTYEPTSKLLQMLEEPQASITSASKITKAEATTTTKFDGASGNERILNFDVAKSSPNIIGKQKIIIRRSQSRKAVLNTLSDLSSSDKIVLSKSKPSDESSVQSYTIQTTSEQVPTESGALVIQPRVRKVSKTPPKSTKAKPQKSVITPISEIKPNKIITDDTMFDINSMPVVLSDEILTPENIERMPVMSDANITITSEPTVPSVTKVIKSTRPTIVAKEKIGTCSQMLKSEIKKTLLVNQEHPKVNTPNILSKSAKLRGTKPMLVIDKVTGKQKIIMTKAEPVVKEVKQPPSVIQPTPVAKSDKFVLMPSSKTPRGGRTQKIVIDPQTGKAHVLVAKDSAGPAPAPALAPPLPPPLPPPPLSVPLPSSTPVLAPAPAPVVVTIPSPSPSDTKSVVTRHLSGASSGSDPAAAGSTVMIITNAHGAQSRIVLTPEHERILFPNKQQPASTSQKPHKVTTGPSAQQKSITVSSAPAKAARIVPKQKSAIITSKGQLVVGGRVASGVASIAPRPSPPLRASPVMSEKKVVAQKAAGEPLILLQQKSGAMVQLTPAQFEHLQRTGQLRAAGPAPDRVRARRPPPAPATPPPVVKKTKHEVAIAPAPATAAVAAAATLSELVAAGAAGLADAQLLAVPGEHFGGPGGSFYLCVKQGGSLTPVDSRPLVLEDNQLVPMPQPERRDILEAALASSDVFRADSDAPHFRDLNASVAVHCRVSEVSSTLHQPIMTPAELPRAPSTAALSHPPPATLDAGLKEIGVAPPAVPTSLELPITVTDPRLQPPPPPPPPISMPLLTDEAVPAPPAAALPAAALPTAAPPSPPSPL